MTIITDPLFYAVAIPAVIFLGLSKGGFSGIGMVSTPLVALIMPPLEAAAILLPILLVQDALSAFIYRRVWDDCCFFDLRLAWIVTLEIVAGTDEIRGTVECAAGLDGGLVRLSGT